MAAAAAAALFQPAPNATPVLLLLLLLLHSSKLHQRMHFFTIRSREETHPLSARKASFSFSSSNAAATAADAASMLPKSSNLEPVKFD